MKRSNLKTSLFLASFFTSFAVSSSSVSAQDYPYIAGGGGPQTVGSCTPYSGCVSSSNVPGSSTPYYGHESYQVLYFPVGPAAKIQGYCFGYYDAPALLRNGFGLRWGKNRDKDQLLIANPDVEVPAKYTFTEEAPKDCRYWMFSIDNIKFEAEDAGDGLGVLVSVSLPSSIQGHTFIYKSRIQDLSTSPTIEAALLESKETGRRVFLK